MLISLCCEIYCVPFVVFFFFFPFFSPELIWASLHSALGGVPSPFDCYLCNRGLKTLHLRMEQHFKNAMAAAKYLEADPRVERVIFPGDCTITVWILLEAMSVIIPLARNNDTISQGAARQRVQKTRRPLQQCEPDTPSLLLVACHKWTITLLICFFFFIVYRYTFAIANFSNP